MGCYQDCEFEVVGRATISNSPDYFFLGLTLRFITIRTQYWNTMSGEFRKIGIVVA